MESKICNRCKEERLLDKFSSEGVRKDGTPRYNGVCKPCQNKRQYENLKKNPEAMARALARGRTRNKRLRETEEFKERRKKYVGALYKDGTYYYFNKYKVSPEEHKTLQEKTNNGCYICGAKAEETTKKKLYIDHNHTTGKIRGLLCNKCNAGLGYFNNNSELLKKASNYIGNME